VTSAWVLYPDHVRLSVRVTPNARQGGLDGFEDSADGTVWLKARVTVVPEKGKATKAVIEIIAKALHVPKSSISVLSGDTARKKILRIDGNPEDIVVALEKLKG
jgi:uncharacterized protein